MDDTQDDGNEAANISKATQLYNSGDVKGAVLYLDSLEDGKQSAVLKSLREKFYNEYRDGTVKKTRELIKNYDYKGAAALLTDLSSLSGENDAEVLKLLKMCEDFSVTEVYTGAVEHIFFHPLIAYPELAFDGDGMQRGFDEYFVTVPEFKEIINELYAENFVLIDIRLLYSADENGKVTKNELLLPKGKRPLVLSIDDLNFYRYMKKNGMVHGFAINGEGEIVTYTDSTDGTRTYSDDNEIVPILEKFIEQHPDFSYGGRRGIIASTGYEGTLGFRTDEMDAPDYPERLQKAKQIADKLKDMGWIFACHSYGHNSPSKRSVEQMRRDCDKWIKEATPVLGKTDIYIYPFGELIKDNDPKFLYLVEKGYRMFCGVQKSPYIRFHGSYVLMQRRNIDGISLKDGRVKDILDPSKILDPLRPKTD
ncbi:MAG: hypothetical protein Q8878_04865 [Bacillota bacterium]|nr:hypothetical protein [Bacillota bacterium]